MADRLLVFANPEVQKLLREEFVAVTGDDWIQRRRKDQVGEFFRSVAQQGPQRDHHTKQGHYVLTVGGKLLGFDNSRGLERRLEMMKEALKKWEGLPVADKKAEVPELRRLDDGYHHELPEGGQIVKVFTRSLEERDGRLQRLAAVEVGNQAAVDHLWLKKEEVGKLGELIASGGGEIPEWLGLRIGKFYLRDNTRGEPRDWKKEEIKEWSLKVDSEGKMKGVFLIEAADGELGYEGTFEGALAVEKGVLTKFDLLVLGKHWGEGRYTRGARPGKTPMGQVFQLTEGKEARDRIPPQGIRWAPGYWEPDGSGLGKDVKGAALEQEGNEIHAHDRDLVAAIKKKMKEGQTIWAVRKTLGKKKIFDGLNWGGNARFFKIHTKNKDAGRLLNKRGSYLIWKLPSSEVSAGRTQIAGLFWRERNVSEIFFGEVENFNAER